MEHLKTGSLWIQDQSVGGQQSQRIHAFLSPSVLCLTSWHWSGGKYNNQEYATVTICGLQNLKCLLFLREKVCQLLMQTIKN